MKKKFYIAQSAQVKYVETLKTARTGVNIDAERLAQMDKVLSPSIRKGQSVSAVMMAHPELFKGIAVSTVYGWLEAGLFSARTSDLPFAGRRRKPRKKPETKTNAKCRLHRTIREMWEWLNENADIAPTELDTVIGAVGGKVLYTIVFPKHELGLGFLRESKTSQTTTRLFNMLWKISGADLFVRLFRCILTDNGTEFSDPDMIENYRPDPEHNPYKLMSRGIKVWYADPYCSSQKPHVERFHLDLRRILQKGTSFDPLTQDQINMAISHLNSYPREALNGKTPYDSFVEEFGEEGRRFLESLGIVKISAGEVTLHPYLLGQKYQKAADAAILKKAGVVV